MMKKINLVVPIMIFVAGIAMWMLNKEYSEIDLPIRLAIATGAALLSGGISYLLFALDERDKANRS